MNIDTIVIGAGHAGTTMGYFLKQANREYVILEKKVAFDHWKSFRWDSFVMNTPLEFHRLPGQVDDHADDLVGCTRDQVVGLWDKWLEDNALAVRGNCEVVSVSKVDDLFLVKVNCEDDGPKEYVAKNVVACVGSYQTPKIPKELSSKVKDDILQLDVTTYENAMSLQEGDVLVVGGSLTGIQIAEDIATTSDKKVYLATSKVKGVPRSYRGSDLFYWLRWMKFFDRTVDMLPNPEMKYGEPPITGADHAVSHYSLAKLGINLLGRLEQISEEGNVASFADDLKTNIEASLAGYNFFLQLFDGFVEQAGLNDKHPSHEREEAWDFVLEDEIFQKETPLSLDLEGSNIRNILWATGWDFNVPWLEIEELLGILDERTGKPTNIETPVPGFFWMGFPWIRTAASKDVFGFPDDAQHILSKLES